MNNFELVHLLLNSMPINIYWKDIQGKYLGCNLAQANFFGLSSPEDVIGKTDFDLFKNHDRVKEWTKNDQEVIQSSTPLVSEETAIINNQEITGLSCKIPFKDSSDKVIGIIGVTIDITKQKKKEKQLQKEKERAEATLENIIEQLPAHVYWMDTQNRFLGCNALQAQSAGFKSPKEMIGKTNYDMPWSDVADVIVALNNQVMETGKEYVEEQEAELADGKKYTFLSKKAPLLDETGLVNGTVGVSLDITDRKKMEQELLEAKEKAEAANRAKTEFLANMSHDVKSPMSGIVMS